MRATKANKGQKKSISQPTTTIEEEEVKLVTSKGRPLKRPKRFKQ